MQLLQGEHVLVVGQTGSGKSWFVRLYLLLLFPYFVIYDTKRQDPWSEWMQAYTVWTPDGLALALAQGQRRIHYAARFSDRETRVQEINQICEMLLRCGHVCLYVDEAAHIATSQILPSGLEMFITSARGAGGTLIIGSQRATSLIHPTLRTQCIHKFMGFMDPEDLGNKTVRLAFPVEHNPPYHSFEFIYRGPDGHLERLGGKKPLNPLKKIDFSNTKS